MKLEKSKGGQLLEESKLYSNSNDKVTQKASKLTFVNISVFARRMRTLWMQLANQATRVC